MVNIPQQLVGGSNLLGVLVGVVLLQEGQAVHVTAAQPIAVIPEAQVLPLTWKPTLREDSQTRMCRML